MIGLAACVAGAKMFRWDAGQRLGLAGQAVDSRGLAGLGRRRRRRRADGLPHGRRPRQGSPGSRPPWRPPDPVEIGRRSPKRIWPASTTPTFTADDGTVVPFAPGLYRLDAADRKRMQAIRSRLLTWKPAVDADLGQRVRALLCVCSVADVLEGR